MVSPMEIISLCHHHKMLSFTLVASNASEQSVAEADFEALLEMTGGAGPQSAGKRLSR